MGKFNDNGDKDLDHFALVVIDYHIDYCWMRPMKTKSETLSKFRQIVHEAQMETLPDDIVGGLDLKGSELVQFCKENKVAVRFP